MMMQSSGVQSAARTVKCVIARSESDEAIQISIPAIWIASLRSQ
jgi:hypothetical protein